MSAPDNNALAQQFLALWQEHVSSMVTDRAALETLLQFMASTVPKDNRHAHASHSSPHSHSAAAPDAVADAMAQCERRLARLEGRLDAMEQSLAALVAGAAAGNSHRAQPARPRRRKRKTK